MRKFLCKIGLHSWNKGHYHQTCTQCWKVEERKNSILFAVVAVVVILASGYWVIRNEARKKSEAHELYQKQNFVPTITDEELKEINEAEFAPKD